LINRFRTCITPTPFVRSAHYQISIFPKRNVGAKTVDLRSRSNEDFLLFLVREGKDYFRATHVRFDGPHRAFNDQLYSDRGREMENDVTLAHKLGGDGLVVNALYRVMKSGILFEAINIFCGPC